VSGRIFIRENRARNGINTVMSGPSVAAIVGFDAADTPEY